MTEAILRFNLVLFNYLVHSEIFKKIFNSSGDGNNRKVTNIRAL